MSRASSGKRRLRPEERYHSQMKVLVEDVALWRLIAADRLLPHGWIDDAAAACGVSGSTVTMAIGGQTWSEMKEPPPVPPKERWAPRLSRRKRPKCPSCSRPKYARGDCRDRFHDIDHRTTRHQIARAKVVTAKKSARKKR